MGYWPLSPYIFHSQHRPFVLLLLLLLSLLSLILLLFSVFLLSTCNRVCFCVHVTAPLCVTWQQVQYLMQSSIREALVDVFHMEKYKLSCNVYREQRGSQTGRTRFSSVPAQATPLAIFRSNSKFCQKLQCSGLKYTLPIITKFSTRHDSYTVVTCVKFCCGWSNIF